MKCDNMLGYVRPRVIVIHQHGVNLHQVTQMVAAIVNLLLADVYLLLNYLLYIVIHYFIR